MHLKHLLCFVAIGVIKGHNIRTLWPDLWGCELISCLLEKEKLFTAMLFLQGCGEDDTKWHVWKDFGRHRVPQCMCLNSKTNILMRTSWARVYTRLATLRGRAIQFLLPPPSPSTQHCAWCTVSAGWINPEWGRLGSFGSRSGNFSQCRETSRVSCYCLLWKHTRTTEKATQLENKSFQCNTFCVARDLCCRFADTQWKLWRGNYFRSQVALCSLSLFISLPLLFSV